MGYYSVRNLFFGWSYRNLVKPVAFLFDPEKVHRLFVVIGRVLGSNFVSKFFVRKMFNYQNKMLEQKVLGIKFRNPVGLAAGFDKNARIVSIMEDVGFGFVEVGSVTAKECGGNEGKRLARIPEKRSLWVHMGLNNDGSDKISGKLRKKKFKIPVGISIAKTNCAETAEDSAGLRDYLHSVDMMKDVGDYITLNISCPNAFGGQSFVKPKLYQMLVREVKKRKLTKPVFVKLSPDLEKREVDKIIEISEKYRVQGFICSNLIKKENLFGKGGLSGKEVEKASEELLEYIYKKTKGKFILIGVGGIFSAEDVYRKMRKGASLVQLITGMIYEGPSLIGKINYDLTQLLKKDGFDNVSEIIGSGVLTKGI